MYCYIISAYRDPYELPLAVLDSQKEVAEYIGCTLRLVEYHMARVYPHIDGYVVEKVEL